MWYIITYTSADKILFVGAKYDIIHIDACTSDPSADLACPLHVFLTPKTVENLSKLITDKGLLA